MSSPSGRRRGSSWLRPVLILAVAVVGVVLLGPRVPVDTEVPTPDLPDGGLTELAEWVAASEREIANITPGAEKAVLLADTAAPGVTPLSVVYLHGFSATRREIEPVPTLLAERLGANRFMARLTGHGRGGAAMAEASVNAWLRDGEEALAVGAALGERVVLVGTSTGGTLALWLAMTSPLRDRIGALVLISPNLGVPDPKADMLLWPWGGFLVERVLGPEYSFEPRNDEQARWWTTRYPSRALLPMQALVQLVQDGDLSAVNTPVLTLYSPDDEVVDPARIAEGVERVGSGIRHTVSLPGQPGMDPHVLAGDILSPGNTGPVTDSIAAFVNRAATARDR